LSSANGANTDRFDLSFLAQNLQEADRNVAYPEHGLASAGSVHDQDFCGKTAPDDQLAARGYFRFQGFMFKGGGKQLPRRCDRGRSPANSRSGVSAMRWAGSRVGTT
jgi:hypothetical protein